MPWLPPTLRIYAGAMNEAIRPGPESLPQTAALPQLSIVVPTFNEIANVGELSGGSGRALGGVVGSHIRRR